MAATERSNLGRRLRLAVAGAAVVTVLTTATAGAATPTPMGGAAPMGVQAPAMTRPAASGPVPGFLLERGRYTPVAIPRRLAATAPWGSTPPGSTTAARSWASTSTTA
jgi:hypothetical protein